jgi:hypothetical protein
MKLPERAWIVDPCTWPWQRLFEHTTIYCGYWSEGNTPQVYFQGMVDMEGLTTPLVDRLYQRE